MKYKLYIPALGGTIDDAYEIDCKFDDADMVVTEYCEYLWSKCDGWEWMADTGRTTKICVVDENGNQSFYSFEVDFNPVFSAWRQDVE